MEVLNKAIAKGSGIEVEEAVAATVRGVQALERRAIELGAEPVSGEVWEETTPQGAVIAVCRDGASIAKIRTRAGSTGSIRWRRSRLSSSAGKTARRVN